MKFPKSRLWTLGCRQKIHHFFFSHTWSTRFKYLTKLCPYILMYSALHIMQWFSRILDVFNPKIRRKFFDFYILRITTNVAYTRFELIARTKYCTTTLQLQCQTDLLLCIINCFLQWALPQKHGRQRSSLLLYSISMIVTGAVYEAMILHTWKLLSQKLQSTSEYHQRYSNIQ